MAINGLEHLRVEQDERAVATVTIDVARRRTNVVDEELLRELHSVVADLETDTSLRLVVFRSGKKSGFLAGADLNRIRAIETRADAEGMLKQGQELMQRIESLPVPTLAVIHGPCLGGGLEFALACRFRIARDDSSTCLGLPETRLGLIPGWGGTARLPRVVGLSAAVTMILDGSRLNAEDSERLGLIDAKLKPAAFESETGRYVDQCLIKHGALRRASNRPASWRDGSRLGQRMLLWMTRRRIAGQAKQNPALPAALRAITAGVDDGPEAGMAQEREEFCRILFTPECRHLLDQFFERERARKRIAGG